MEKPPPSKFRGKTEGPPWPAPDSRIRGPPLEKFETLALPWKKSHAHLWWVWVIDSTTF